MVGRPWFVGFAGVVSCVVLTALVSSGCSPGGYRGPMGTVTGKITLSGEPLPSGCLVTFISDAGFTASGRVGAGGSYSLLDVDKPQIPVAKYKVSISPPPAQTSGDDYDKYMTPDAGAAAAPAEVVPAKYTVHTTSGLTYDVTEGPNTINIELEK